MCYRENNNLTAYIILQPITAKTPTKFPISIIENITT